MGASLAPFLWATLLVSTPAAPSIGAAPAVNATAIYITHREARWTSLIGIDDLSDGYPPYFVVSGEVRNATGKPVRFVKLLYELLDESGTVLVSEYGYNHRAEDLRRPEYEDGVISLNDLQIAPLQPGETDTFRMLFLRSDIPRFWEWRVRIIEVAPQ